jgi:AAA domain
MTRQGYARSAMLSVLLDKNNRISDHIYDQSKPREYALSQIKSAAEEVGVDDRPQIRSIEIRPGQVETFKVSMKGGTVVVDAEALNHFPWFNRAAIAQLRRSFPPIRAKAWSNEVDRALRVAREPVALVEEQARRHGTDSWRDDPVAWLIRERLPEQGVGLLAGMYSTYKSFVLLDLCGGVMTGLPVLNARVVRRGGVLIFAAEGARDLPMRMKALVVERLAKETDDPDLFKRSKIDLGRLPFSYVAHCRPLLDPKTVEWMVAKAREEQAYFQNQFGLDLVLIGIDTMAAAAGWQNENDAAQAQIVMNHLADVSKATNTFVIAVDHFGKNLTSGTRGSVVKECSADALLATLGERDEETHSVIDTRLVLQKLRSGPQGLDFPFEARVVDMGEDRDGEPLTSRVINWNVVRPEKAKPEKKTEAQSALEVGLAQTFETDPIQIKVDGVTEVLAVREELLRTTFMKLYQERKPGLSANALRQAWSKALDKMGNSIERGVVDGAVYVWWKPTPM